MAELATRSPYTAEDIERGLLAVAAYAGNHRAAAQALAEANTPIPRTTLQHWTGHLHTDRYLQIRDEQAPKFQAQAAAGFEDIIQIAHGVQLRVLARIDAEVDNLKPADLSRTGRDVATIQGISTDKSLGLRGQPTQIIEHRAPEQILKQLARRYGQAIDSTAEDITDAEQVPEPQATSSASGQ